MKLTRLLLTVAVLSPLPLGAAVVLAVNPPVQSVAIGASANVQFTVSGLTAGTAPALGAYDLNLSFDPALFAFQSLTFGDQLDPSGLGTVNGSTLTSPGLLEFFEVSLDSVSLLNASQPDSFTLATVQFKALAGGTTSLKPALLSATDALGQPLAIALQSGSLAATAVPEPAAWSLLAFSLAALILRERIQHRRA